jgi:AcrR family transcriptional regulator
MSDRTSHRDPRLVRTHERLREALLSLTLEYGWDGVSVQQVCERAGVGRSTFYVHFADREDLLLATFRSDHIVSHRTTAREPLAFVQPLVEHVGEHRGLYGMLVGTSCERAVTRRFGEVVSDMIEGDLSTHAAASSRRTAAVRYLTGAFCETLTFWLEQQSGPSAAELEGMLKQFSMPVFERLS